MVDQFEVIAAIAYGNLVLLQYGVGQIESFDVTVTADHTIVFHWGHVDRSVDCGLSSGHFLG